MLVPVWACWHLPLFLLLQSYRDLGPVGLPGFLVGLGCGSIVLGWLYEGSGDSVLLAAVWHGTYNVTSATLGAHGLVAAVVSTGVVAVAAVIAWRAARSQRPSRVTGSNRAAGRNDGGVRLSTAVGTTNGPRLCDQRHGYTSRDTLRVLSAAGPPYRGQPVASHRHRRRTPAASGLTRSHACRRSAS